MCIRDRFWAVQKEHGYILRLLLSNQADPHITNKKGETPLHLAAQKGHDDVVDHLLSNQADPNIENKKGKHPYSCLLYTSRCV